MITPIPEIVSTVEAFEALKPHWDLLVEQMAVPTPFMRWDWVWRWVGKFGGQHRLSVGVLRDDLGVPLAIAPFVISRGDKPPRRWLRHLTWIGGMGEVLGERMDVIVPAGRETELTPRLLRCMDATHKQWDVVWLPAVPVESANLPAMKEALDRVGMGAEEVKIHPCRFTEIPKDWPAYEAARSSRWRRNLRNRWAVFIDEHGGRRGLSDTDMPHAEALDHLARLHLLQWPEGESNFLRPASWEFHRGLALEWLESGRAMLSLLIAGDRVVAAAYGLVKRGQFSLYQQGWDPEFKHLSIGNLVVHWSLETAAQRGLHTYDMLSGDSRYKAEWCPSLRHTVDLETFQPERMSAQGFRVLRQFRRGWDNLTGGSAVLSDEAADAKNHASRVAAV
ncbi:MAG: GNAT family N-acetyltransferase [Prosthecobacter sp.]|nr:GNAT family N-acetyltransferase [Prosthecobacter sp.]